MFWKGALDRLNAPGITENMPLDSAWIQVILVCIWEEAGFNSQRSFNRVFRPVMGMTPMEYKKGQEKRNI